MGAGRWDGMGWVGEMRWECRITRITRSYSRISRTERGCSVYS